MAIPKILHYCWFGKGKMPKTEAKCVDRWNKYFRDYQIICWNEENFDIHLNRYVEEAYSAKKFAYVADVARLKALYEYGGIYLDADCKVLKSFDPLLDCHAFTGFGADNKELAACTLAFEPHDAFIKECLDSYNSDCFVKADGALNTWSINQRMTEILQKYGFKPNGKKQTVQDIIIYPMSYFCPLSMLPDTVKDCNGKDTYSMALWTNPELKRERSLIVRLAHKTGLNKVKRKLLRK
jgi:hypothetical protein